MNNYIFCGCDVTVLANKYGTPLYVMSEDEIVKNINTIKSSFDDRYDNCETFFAAKSFLTKDMLRILMRLNIGLDVVSGGELYLARSMNFPPEKITFHGNSKTDEEIESGVEYGVGKFVCDSIDEIIKINVTAAVRRRTADILIRVTPGIDSHTHEHISTAHADSKFGIPLSYVKSAVSLCMNSPHVKLRGFHFHVGSQLMDNTSHMMALEILLNLMKEVRDELSFETEILDMGGGYGIAYTESDNPIRISEFISPMVERVESFCSEFGMSRPKLVIEPGRSIVGSAGITLYTVGSVKDIPGIRTYVGVDGGFPDNPRYALYGAEYRAVVANRVNEEPFMRATVAGKCCESGDIVIKEITLPNVIRGDIIAVFTTGAYNHSMASNYNKNRIPAVVMIRDGKPYLSVRRQSYEEMYAAYL